MIFRFFYPNQFFGVPDRHEYTFEVFETALLIDLTSLLNL